MTHVSDVSETLVGLFRRNALAPNDPSRSHQGSILRSRIERNLTRTLRFRATVRPVLHSMTASSVHMTAVLTTASGLASTYVCKRRSPYFGWACRLPSRCCRLRLRIGREVRSLTSCSIEINTYLSIRGANFDICACLHIVIDGDIDSWALHEFSKNTRMNALPEVSCLAALAFSITSDSDISQKGRCLD